MMADLIDRKYAYDVLTEYYHHKTDAQHKALREALGKVPSAKIVRCKDCYHYDEEHGRCLLNESSFEPNDFCSYWSE